MPSFGRESQLQLATCDLRLQHLFAVVIQHWDCSILEGHRNKEGQDKAVREGRSQKPWPTGNHNTLPSRAVDVAPYPILWPDPKARPDTVVKDYGRWYAFAGFVLGVAAVLGINIRWGGDWNSNRDLTDQKFDDLPHFELVD